MKHLFSDFMQKNSHGWTRVITLLLLASASLPLYAALTIVERDKVIIVTAQQLTNLKTHKMDAYSLVAVKNGALEPIPYQFDEMTKDGFVYIEGADSLALTIEGVKSHLKGRQYFFDEDDQLLFMFRDAGPRRTKQMKLLGEPIAEIAITAADGQQRYVYVVRDARITSETYYVRYSSEMGRAETDYYSLRVNPKNALVWDEFYFESYEGNNPRQPFDTMKLGMSGHVLGAGAIPIYLTNKSLKAKPLAEKAGPIRATTTFRLTLKFLGIPWFVNKLQIQHYETSIRYDFIMRMPELRRQYMGNLRANMSMDGRDLQGSDIVFSQRSSNIEKVDGKRSPIESEMHGFELALDERNWIWLDTHKKFATFMAFEVSQTTRVEKDFNAPRLRYIYKDSEEDKQRHEFYKGQLPDAGFEVRFPQFGRIKMSMIYDMFAYDVKQNVQSIADEVYKMPKIEIIAF